MANVAAGRARSLDSFLSRVSACENRRGDTGIQRTRMLAQLQAMCMWASKLPTGRMKTGP